jgi:hypothetical protein
MANPLTSSSDVLIQLHTGEFRTVSKKVLSGTIPISEKQIYTSRQWVNSLTSVRTLSGDVVAILPEVLCDYPVQEDVVSAAVVWMQEQGLPVIRNQAPAAALACRAAPYHNDIAGFGDSLFCIVWAEEAAGLELVFPELEHRVNLALGTIVVFDPGQPHGVLKAGLKHYRAQDYRNLPAQSFISLDFGTELDGVSEQMGIEFRETSEGWPGLLVWANGSGPKTQARTGAWKQEKPFTRKIKG